MIVLYCITFYQLVRGILGESLPLPFHLDWIFRAMLIFGSLFTLINFRSIQLLLYLINPDIGSRFTHSSLTSYNIWSLSYISLPYSSLALFLSIFLSIPKITTLDWAWPPVILLLPINLGFEFFIFSTPNYSFGLDFIYMIVLWLLARPMQELLRL